MNRAQTAGVQIRPIRRTASTPFRPVTQQQFSRDIHYKDSISKSEVVEIAPKQITFSDIEPNLPYETIIMVKNLSKIPRRIRITQPKTAKFRVDYDMQGPLAAGLSLKLILYFETTVSDDYHDRVIITSEDNFRYELEVHALKPQASIQFSSFLDMGYAQVGTPKLAELEFKNSGKLSGKVTLKSSILKLDPVNLTLAPNSTTVVKVEYLTQQAAVLRTQIQVIQPLKQVVDAIDVSCIAVDYAIFFIDKQQAQTTLVDFKETIMGYSKQYSGSLVNNTPITQSWKVLIKKGFHTSVTTVGQLQTPNQVGSEWLEKVIRVHPDRGTLEPYAQIPIRIECKSPVNEESILKAFRSAYRLKRQEEQPIEFGYSLFFEFQEKQDEQLIVHIQGKHIRPQLIISKQALAFGDCSVNETKDAVLIVENTHRNHSIDVSFSKAPQFLVSPQSLTLAPLVKTQFIVTFAPKNVGKVSSQFDLLMVDGQYSIKVTLSGHAIFNPTRRPVTRGPEALPADFNLKQNFIDDEQLQYLDRRRHEIKSENMPRKKNLIEMFFDDESELSLVQQQQHMQGLSEYEQERYSEKLQQYYQTKQNQDKYNQYLRSQRSSRIQKQRDQIIQMRVEDMQERMKEKMKDQYQPDDDRPVDLEFQLGLLGQSMNGENDPSLPEACDGLFVTKPIDKYEPLINQYGIFNPDPLQQMKKPFAQEPQTHKEIREVNMDLNGEELKKIQAGPVEIDYGQVFVKSRISRTFHIKNDLRTSISCQVQVDVQELNQTYQKLQVIPSSETAKFEIVLQSDKLGLFQQQVKYVINGRHRFEFAIKANIEPVRIEVSSKDFKFAFKEDSQHLDTQETIRLTNPGNATAQFKWQQSEQKVFYISQVEGSIEAGKYLDLQISYKPSNCLLKDEKPSPIPAGKSFLNTTINNQIRQDDDKLILEVVDGKEQTVKVQGVVNDAKCTLKHVSVDMKELLVCKSEVKYFSIRNVSKVAAVFKILGDKMPAACDITPLTGKILPDESRDITVKYMSKDPTDVKQEITIVVRGGRVLKIPFYVRTIIPLVEIVQEQFDFGKLTTLGNEGNLKMILVNSSAISAELVLNLDKDSPESPDGIECLRIVPVDELDKSVLKSIHEDEPSNKVDTSENEDIGSDAGSEQSQEEIEQAKSKTYFLTIQGNSKLEFWLKFSPRDVKTYTFELPIVLYRYGRLASLTRQIICRGLKPRFVMDPQTVEFQRKIITSLEKCFPATHEITLSNPERKQVNWRLDVSNLNENVFNINPTEGKIDSGQTVKVKAHFNPYKADTYMSVIPVYIDSQEGSYIELILKGQAAEPKIQFDRREILLPTAPLNIDSSCTFRILNDGYENLRLRHKVYGEEGNIKIELIFPEGQIVGMSKKRLRVLAKFQSPRPISFTTKIEFYDETGKVYTIPVSGTADNCLLTCYSYLQRCVGEYKIEEKPNQGAIIIADNDEDVQSNDGRHRGAQSMMSQRTLSSLSGRSTTSALGYTPIPMDLVEQNKVYATKWFKFFVQSANIHSFPEGVIEQDGGPIFELFSLLSGRQLPLPCQQNLDKNSKKIDRVEQLLKQYDEFIRMLKSEGALLNHIRPYHLLSLNDLNTSFKLIPSDELEVVHPIVLKITQQRFNYISIDSWCAVFHQIIKIYALNRLNPKQFRLIPGLPSGDRGILPESYISGSNLYSSQEGMLLRWLELCYESQLNQAITQNVPRIRTFDTSLRDGLHFAAALQHYVGGSVNKHLTGLKQNSTTEADFKFNASKIINTLGDMKFLTPFEMLNFAQPSAREMVIFTLHLQNQLAHYIPRGTEVFSCILGQQIVRTLNLSNKTNRVVSYWVKLEKDEDFKLEGGDTIKIEPNSTYAYKIRFISRLSMPVTDRITFMSKREHNIFAGAIVYDLKSSITGRESKSVEYINAPLYEQKDFPLSITNEFLKADFANFSIRLVFERVQEPNKRKKLGGSQIKEDVFPTIFCRQDSVRLKRSANYQLLLQYIPLVMETQKCLVIFTDVNVGEFQHEIIATADQPEITPEPRTYQVFVDNPQQLEFALGPRNDLMLQARKAIEQLYTEGKQAKKQLVFPGGEPESTGFDVEFTNHFGYLIAPKQFTVVDVQRQKVNKAIRDKQEKERLEKEKIELGDKQITQAPSLRKMDVSMLSNNLSVIPEGAGVPNRMPITFSFKNPVRDMPIIMTLRSQDRTDVRRYKMQVTALPKPTKATLEMKCPSREVLTQEIPIINPTDKEWTLKLQFTQDPIDGYQVFTLPNCPQTMPTQHDHSTSVFIAGYKDIQVKRKSRFDIKLQFSPKWICKTDAHILITNTNTNDIQDYQITGIGEEPLAQNNIILNCRARVPAKTEIVLQNHSTTALKYRVETNLSNASGLTSFSIQPQKKYRYELNVIPMLSGQENGSISFFEESGEYIWYTIVLITESPPPEKDIEILTQSRKPVAFDIELNNPMPSEQATFEVQIIGDHLFGAKYFSVLPGTSSIYELIYLPHLPEKKKGQIGFIHYKLGEIWYNLNLISEERQATRVPIMRAELGKAEQYEVLLENPTSQEVQVTTLISNPGNFDVLPATITLLPFETTSVYIRYVPSNLDQVQTGEITFQTTEIGKWDYLVYGMGIPPTLFPETTVTVGINKDYSDVIHFKNPFRDAIQVQILIESDDPTAEEAFTLLLKKKNDTKTTIPALQNIQIPFSFTPIQIRSYRCEIVVQMNDKIKWRYPLVGHTESFASGKFTQFKTKCRIQLVQDFQFNLAGIGNSQQSDFTYELKNIPMEVKGLVDRFFKLRMLTQNTEGKDEILFEALFTPLKPFKANFDLVVKRESGGVWKFPISLEALPPDQDDFIVITSPLNKSANVAFRITNRTKQYAPFKAYFMPTSDQEFTVNPKQGQLEPNGREGTQFIIQFTPLEYGQIRQGILVIETEDMYWTYSVRGTLPKYEPPVGQSKIDDHLGIQQQTQNFKPKNFMQKNIKKSNSPTQHMQQKSTGLITNMNMSRRTLGNTLKDTKSFQGFKTTKIE